MKKGLFSCLLIIFFSALAMQAQDVDVPGNLTMVDSTATAGNILKNGLLFMHNFGTNNTFLGINAGNLTMSGVANTASGSSALSSNITGNSNTASGYQALLNNTTGDSNTASGVSALVNNTSGSDNTASGFETLKSNTTGCCNTAVGAHALQNNTISNGNTAVGAGALELANVFNGQNTAIGVNALASNTNGFGNTAVGAGAFSNMTTGNDNTAIGNGTTVSGNLTNATAIGSGTTVDANNKIRLGNGIVTVIEGQVAYTFVSDKNQKENFQPVEGEQVLRKIRGLSLTSWNYIGHDPKQFRHYGPVAQEFFGAFGHDAVGTIGNSTTINSGDMEGILMVAVQALEKRTRQENIRLEKTVEALNAENAELKARLEAIERRFSGNAMK